MRVVGWTADADAPQTPLTVHISVDGAFATSATANVSRRRAPSSSPEPELIER